jgi:hypothetical protein
MSVLAKPVAAPPSPVGEQAASTPSPTISAAKAGMLRRNNEII